MKKTFPLFLLLFTLLCPISTFAQEAEAETITEPVTEPIEVNIADVTPVNVTGIVEEVIEEQLEPAAKAYQVVEVRILTEGEYKNRTFQVDSRASYLSGLRHRVEVGQKVQLAIMPYPDMPATVFITDVIRLAPLMWLIIIFILTTLIVGLLRGLSSLFSLAIIITILFTFILPNLLAGRDPVIFTLIGAAMILLVSIFATHGFRKESLVAFLGTLGGLIVTGVLATIFVPLTELTGLASEEAARLQLETGMSLNAQGILLAAIIIGALGVLDDVAVTQSETVFELKSANPNLKLRELAGRALRIGRHHIASVTNTLVLAYAGASLPLLLLFITADETALDLINHEFIAEEIVRTLVGTIGLICTVPVATWIAAIYAKRSKT